MSISFVSSAIRPVLMMLALAVAPPLAFAQDLAPDVLVKTIAQDIVARIKQDRDTYAASPSKLVDLIETKVLPHFNFAHTTQIAMGADWRRASPEQQGQIIQEFKTLLVRTYSNALMSYRDASVEYKPLHVQPGDKTVTVRSQVRRSGAGEPIAIDYEMENTSSGWKIYDLKIDNASLAAVYRSSFAEEIRNHGIDGLIDLLSSKNHQNNAKALAVSA
jgi:phospholipid transport system substrate-binding protein